MANRLAFAAAHVSVPVPNRPPAATVAAANAAYAAGSVRPRRPRPCCGQRRRAVAPASGFVIAPEQGHEPAIWDHPLRPLIDALILAVAARLLDTAFSQARARAQPTTWSWCR